MPEWLAISIGVIAGLLIVAGALAWALRPRRPGAASRLPAPSDPGQQYEAPCVPPHDGVL